jgi:lipoate-protein ligase A
VLLPQTYLFGRAENERSYQSLWLYEGDLGGFVSDYPRKTWRLVHTGLSDGPTNMAVDEAILRAVAEGNASPTLRFYAWEPGCLSLGRGQSVSDVDQQALAASGFDLVRRPTGGRAILHIDELTYSVVAPQQEPQVIGTIVESYRRLSNGLIRGLEHLGVPNIVADQRVENRGREGAVCFEVPADYEITVGGRKLAGSAQMRSRGVVLQHGTLPLHGDITRICSLLSAHPDPNRVRARATTVAEILGRAVSWEEAVQALKAGFAEALNLRLEPGHLTAQEQHTAKKLRAEKYGADAWTKRV